jgi:23S rRNA A2030 N6-methylase RlmJ
MYLQVYAGGGKKIRAALRGDDRLTPLEIHSYTGAQAERRWFNSVNSFRKP